FNVQDYSTSGNTNGGIKGINARVNHNVASTVDEATAVSATVDMSGPAATVTLAQAVWSRLSLTGPASGTRSVPTATIVQAVASLTQSGGTLSITDLAGIKVSGWAKSGTPTVTNSYGIYMDSTIDVGTTKYALYSLSASPSLLTGDLTVPTLWLGGTVSPANTGNRYLELNKTFAPGANTRAMDIQLVGTDNSAVLGLDFTIASSGSNPLLVTAISGQGQYQGTGTMTGQVTGVSASATNT